MSEGVRRRVVVGAARWVSGVLFVVGLLGLLRRHLDGFASAPGVDVLWLTATPLGHLLIFVCGVAGLVALRTSPRSWTYLAWIGGPLILLGIGGRLVDVLSFNTRMAVLLIVLGVLALAGALVGRRLRPVLSSG